ncbi:hypothetical protein AB7849_15260 [Rhodanobacter sp. 115]
MPTWMLIVFYISLPGFVWGFAREFPRSFFRGFMLGATGRRPRIRR